MLQTPEIDDPIKLSASAKWDEPKQLQQSIAANIAFLFEKMVLPAGPDVPNEKAWSEYLRQVIWSFWI